METSIGGYDAALSNADRDLQIRQHVRELALQYKDSRQLSREVCRLLFYRYGETPNANRIYGLTRKGSLTTISEEVAGFWRGLREQTQVHIPCAGLAPELAERFGGFLTELIKSVEQRLTNELEAQRQAAHDQVRIANLELEHGRDAIAALKAEHQRELERQLERTTDTLERLAAAQHQLVSEKAISDHLRQEIVSWQIRTEAAQDQVQKAQILFTQEVANLSQSLAASEERAMGAEQYALARIEEERKLYRQQSEKLAHLEEINVRYQRREERLNDLLLKATEESALLKGKMNNLDGGMTKRKARGRPIIVSRRTPI